MTETLSHADLLGAWVSIFLTLCVFSFLYDDNPFYKLAEHLFIGTSIGIIITEQFLGVLKPNLWDKITLHHELHYLICAVLVLFLFAKLVPGKSWLAHYPIAFVVGVYSGRSIPAYAQSDLLTQIHATMYDLTAGDWSVIIGRVFMLIGVCCGLVYFYFSRPHTGVLGVASRIGTWVLMIAFGASFGYTVQGRIALLVGRFQELLGLDRPVAAAQQIGAPAASLFFLMVIALGLWALRRPQE
jgi:hypothetical protein